MSILSAWLGKPEEDQDMARASTARIDTAKINVRVQQLKLAVRDASSFQAVFEEIEADTSLTAAELVAIAHSFAGGIKPKNRKAALIAIAQERHRAAHALAKGGSAAKSRVW
jgi:hypothetical protein